MDFDGFVSYTHADARLAEALQRGVQGFAKPWYRRRALRLFRDDTTLATGAELWPPIEAALATSEWFVLLASPGSGASAWVGREVAWWLEHREASRILLVHTDGELRWDGEAGRFSEGSDAIPARLSDAFASEPRHLDLRWVDEGSVLSTRNPRFAGAIADLAAPMRGMAKDDLYGEDIRQHRRAILLARAVAAVIVTMALLAGAAAVVAVRSRARAQAARIESDYERVLAQSRDLRSRDRSLGALLALEAHRSRDTPTSRNAVEGAIAAAPGFLGGVVEGGTAALHLDTCVLELPAIAVTTDDDGRFSFTSLTTGERVGPRRILPGSGRGARGKEIYCASSADGRSLVIYSRAGLVWRIDAVRRRSSAAMDVGTPINQIGLSPDGRTMLVGGTTGRLLVGPTDGSRTLHELSHGEGVVAAAYSADGRAAASTSAEQVTLWDTADWSVTRRLAAPPQNEGGALAPTPDVSRQVQFSADGRWLGDSRTELLRFFDLTTGKPRWEIPTLGAILPISFRFVGSEVIAERTATTASVYSLTSGSFVGPDFATQRLDTRQLSVWTKRHTIVVTGARSVQLFGLDGQGVLTRAVGAPGQKPRAYSPSGARIMLVSNTVSVVGDATIVDVADGRRTARLLNVALPYFVDDETVEAYFVDEGKVDRYDLRTRKKVGPAYSVDLAGVTDVWFDRGTGRLFIGRDDGTIDAYDSHGHRRKAFATVDGRVVGLNTAMSGNVLGVISETSGSYLVDIASGRILRRVAIADITLDPTGTLAAGPMEQNPSRFGFVSVARGTTVDSRIPTDGRYSSVWPTGHRLMLVGDDDGQVYDVGSRQPIGEPLASANLPLLRPGGLQVATSTARGVLLWDLDERHWDHAACRVAGRNLTRSEWQTYFPRDRYRRTCAMWA